MRPALRIEVHDLAVEHDIAFKRGGEIRAKRREALANVVAARDQLGAAVLDARDRAEAVVLQLEDLIGIVERIAADGEAHLSAGKLHGLCFQDSGRGPPAGPASVCAHISDMLSGVDGNKTKERRSRCSGTHAVVKGISR